MRVFCDRVVTPDGVAGGVVTVAEGSIAAVTPGDRVVGEVDVDLGDAWLVPGFIDVHVHGGGGAQCNTLSADEVVSVARFHARHGTTGLLATTVAAPVLDLVGVLGAIGAAVRDGSVRGGARVLGAHLEGPFLCRAAPGAMDASAFVDPDPQVWRELALAGGGCVALMTLAPELPGAPGLMRELVDAGIVVSLGHSHAGVADARGAVAAGARSATHIFNAMGPLHHRAPGLAGVALDDERVSCELICDGIHVDPVVARLVHRCKGAGGVHLITDAIAAAGMGDGAFVLGSTPVAVTDGVARLATDPSALAGSTLTMDAAVGNAVRFLGVPVETAVAMASANPARLLGLEDRYGQIAPGFAADLAVLDDDLRCVGTMVGGEWVFRSG